MAFVASKTFLYVKSALNLHGAFWLYGCLGTVGFFVIYWTFSETEGRSLEDIEEFYKKGIRGKIPKRAPRNGNLQELPKNFTPSMNSLRDKNENMGTKDEDMTVTKSKINFSKDTNGGIVGISTETLQTTFTASAASLQDRESTTGDVTEIKVDRDIQHLPEKKTEEAEKGTEKYDKIKSVENEKSNTTANVEGKSSEFKAMGDQVKEAKSAAENNVDIDSDTCVKENVVTHKGAGVDERTSM
jgi:hypothetical protein